MANVELKTYKLSNIDFLNNITGKAELHFSNKISHNVKYIGNKFCEAELSVGVYDKENPDSIAVNVTVVGAFDILTDVQKEFIHVDTFKYLFPMVKGFIATLSGMAGIPPIIIKDFDIEKQEIYRMETPHKN